MITRKKRYRVKEIFYSLQGEGIFSGTPSIFLRFSGCNLDCKLETHGFNCDTDFIGGVWMSVEEICETLGNVGFSCRRLVLTGGEPLLQVDVALLKELKNHGYLIAIETNGTIEVQKEVAEYLDWVTCSPKVEEKDIKLTLCNELKYVRVSGQELPSDLCLNACQNKLISPAYDGEHANVENIDWCISLVKKNPEWRLSLQLHKVLKIR